MAERDVLGDRVAGDEAGEDRTRKSGTRLAGDLREVRI